LFPLSPFPLAIPLLPVVLILVNPVHLCPLILQALSILRSRPLRAILSSPSADLVSLSYLSVLSPTLLLSPILQQPSQVLSMVLEAAVLSLYDSKSVRTWLLGACGKEGKDGKLARLLHGDRPFVHLLVGIVCPLARLSCLDHHLVPMLSFSSYGDCGKYGEGGGGVISEEASACEVKRSGTSDIAKLFVRIWCR
ncbi:hypothetical protein P7C73_g6600, partial [Tremellales sp. Uapishka_1]